jgi:hypothetical protein
MRIVWKKKVYDPPGYTGAIIQVEVDGDPTTMPEIYEWYAYGNGKEVNVIQRSERNWLVKLGTESAPVGFMRAVLFQVKKEKTVKSAQEAKELAEGWLSE